MSARLHHPDGIASTPPTLHRRLRAETGSRHQALEDALPITRDWARAGVYRDHLRYLLAFHEGVEPALHALAPLRGALPDLDTRRKAPLLRADLGCWAGGPRPAPARLPQPRALADGLGVLYVMEGATLGARTLLPRLRAAGVVPGAIGQRYLRGYGGDTAARWKRVLAALGAVPAAVHDDVVRGAVATFDALHAWRREWEALG